MKLSKKKTRASDKARTVIYEHENDRLCRVRGKTVVMCFIISNAKLNDRMNEKSQNNKVLITRKYSTAHQMTN